jgi:flavin reductase (DIM6/NTAB) family NADH-FMN oxidoreductase RutF
MPKQIWKPGNMLYPLPAVMVSCGRQGETPNIITVAWAGNICTNPPMLSISVRKERFSHAIIKETGEFVVNLVGRDLVKAADWCGVKSGRDVNKFKELHLTPEQGQIVKAPLIAESPLNIECQVTEIKELGSHDMFMARVVAIDAEERLIDKSTGAFQLNHCSPLAYSHGKYYGLGEKLGGFGFSVKKKR